MKKSGFVLFALALMIVMLASSVSAAGVAVSLEAINDRILDFEKGYAEFRITLENTGNDEETFVLWNLDPPSWYAQTIPEVASKELVLGPGDSGSYHFMIKSSGNVAEDNGKAIIVTAFIRPLSDPTNPIRIPMRVVIGTSTKKIPDPKFDVAVSVPSQVDPRNSYNIVVTLANENSRNLQNISVILASDLISDSTFVDVAPNESKSASFAIILPADTAPQSDQMHVAVAYQGKTFYEGDHNFEVVEYLPPFKTSIALEKAFLKETRVITVVNEGNNLKTDTLRLQAGFKDKLFSSSSPKFTFLKEDGAYYFTWPVSLDVGDSTEITLVTSYRWLILVVILLILYLGYRISRSNPLIVKKKFQALHKEHKGAISDLVVVIYLKNRGKTAVSGVRVLERISRMVKLKHDSFEGSMHPVKMHTTGAETMLEYRFAEIGPGDERIIKYKVYSQLHIFGSLMMRPTVVEFKTKAGKRRKSKSNDISIFGSEPLSAKTLPKRPPVAVVHRPREDIMAETEKAEASVAQPARQSQSAKQPQPAPKAPLKRY